MELQQLRYFIRTASCASFAQAAASLYVSRAALSKSMAKLESEVGYDLFERSREGVRLTPAGERFRAEAARVVESYERLEQSVRQEHATQKVVVGIPLSLADAFMPAIGRFREAHPDIELVMRSVFDADAQDKLDAGDVDVMVSSFPMRGTLDNGMPLLHSRIQVVMPQGCPLAELAEVRPEDMADYDIVYYTCGFGRFDWAPLVGGRREVFEDDVMMAYSRVSHEGMLFMVMEHAIPCNLAHILSKPFNGPFDTVVVSGFVASHVRGHGGLEQLARTLRDELVLDGRRP